MLWGWSFARTRFWLNKPVMCEYSCIIKSFRDRGLLDSVNGKIAVGWLLVEDLVMVLVLVLLPATVVFTRRKSSSRRSKGNIWLTLGITLLKAVGFIAFMLIVGKRVVPIIMQFVARLGSRELFTLTVVAAAVSIAYGSLCHLWSFNGIRAFFAGMVVKESDFSHRAEEETLPLREIFSILFFVSVGMLFDPHILIERPLHILAVIAIIAVGKTLAVNGLGFILPLSNQYCFNSRGQPLLKLVSFSFILATLGVSLGLLTLEAQTRF
ncbi:cation:proton antiporter [Acinetobacter baumannii]